MTYHYVWLIWSSAFVRPWVLLYALFPRHRIAMWWASGFMAPCGLTQPMFVPEYWNLPSLFESAQTTGLDIESVIFSFAIGGIAAGSTSGSDSNGTFPAHQPHEGDHHDFASSA